MQWKWQIVTVEKIVTECASSQMLPSLVSSEGNLKTGSKGQQTWKIRGVNPSVTKLPENIFSVLELGLPDFGKNPDIRYGN